MEWEHRAKGSVMAATDTVASAALMPHHKSVFVTRTVLQSYTVARDRVQCCNSSHWQGKNIRVCLSNASNTHSTPSAVQRAHTRGAWGAVLIGKRALEEEQLKLLAAVFILSVTVADIIKLTFMLRRTGETLQRTKEKKAPALLGRACRRWHGIWVMQQVSCSCLRAVSLSV